MNSVVVEWREDRGHAAGPSAAAAAHCQWAAGHACAWRATELVVVSWCRWRAGRVADQQRMRCWPLSVGHAWAGKQGVGRAGIFRAVGGEASRGCSYEATEDPACQWRAR
jgi:hypothetical protein